MPVDTTEYVEEKQCLPFELDLAHLNAQHSDPCAGYQSGGFTQLQDHHHVNAGHHDTYHPQPATTTYGAVSAAAGHNHGHHVDPVLQHQPVVVGNQYHVKREHAAPAAPGIDNPFLRKPKSITVNVKRLDKLGQDDRDDGSKGWKPIPYPYV